MPKIRKRTIEIFTFVHVIPHLICPRVSGLIRILFCLSPWEVWGKWECLSVCTPSCFLPSLYTVCKSLAKDHLVMQGCQCMFLYPRSNSYHLLPLNEEHSQTHIHTDGIDFILCTTDSGGKIVENTFMDLYSITFCYLNTVSSTSYLREWLSRH